MPPTTPHLDGDAQPPAGPGGHQGRRFGLVHSPVREDLRNQAVVAQQLWKHLSLQISPFSNVISLSLIQFEALTAVQQRMLAHCMRLVTGKHPAFAFDGTNPHRVYLADLRDLQTPMTSVVDMVGKSLPLIMPTTSGLNQQVGSSEPRLGMAVPSPYQPPWLSPKPKADGQPGYLLNDIPAHTVPYSHMPARLEVESGTAHGQLAAHLVQAEPKSKLKRNRKDPNHIKRPMNPWIIFRSTNCQRVKKEIPGITNNDISKVLSKEWREMAPEDKLYWKLEGKKAQAAHREKHPKYKYDPLQRKRAVVSSALSATDTPSSRLTAEQVINNYVSGSFKQQPDFQLGYGLLNNMGYGSRSANLPVSSHSWHTPVTNNIGTGKNESQAEAQSSGRTHTYIQTSPVQQPTPAETLDTSNAVETQFSSYDGASDFDFDKVINEILGIYDEIPGDMNSLWPSDFNTIRSVVALDGSSIGLPSARPTTATPHGSGLVSDTDSLFGDPIIASRTTHSGSVETYTPVASGDELGSSGYLGNIATSIYPLP